MSNVIIFGAPGSGKGTQSRLMHSHLGFKQISTGDLLRAEVESGSEVGAMCENLMAHGKFPENDIIYGLVTKYLESNSSSKGFVFDGFPRTVEQAKFLLGYLAEKSKKIDVVLKIEVKQELLVKRIVDRFTCKDCGEIYNKHFKRTSVEGLCDKCGGSSFSSRSDDTESTVKTRLNIYDQSTLPVVEFLESKNTKIVSIDGMKSETEVFDEIKAVMA